MKYVIVDLEATCWEGSKVHDMEIIEIGAVLLCGISNQPISDYQKFVLPVENPQLSEFCKKLTTIKQSQIDTSHHFPDVFEEFLEWINQEEFILCSWGNFDMELIELECKRHSMSLPKNFMYHINLKDLYARAYSTKASIGFKQVLRKLDMEFEGTMHRGLDDARNIARVAENLLVLDK